MNPPAPFAEPEHVSDAMRAPRLMRRPLHMVADGFALEVSHRPEPVYLLSVDTDAREIAVPMRVCGEWNPAVLSGRHFFLAHEPDAALTLVSVRRVQHFIGRIVFPSGMAVSPWLSASSRRDIDRRLLAFSRAFAGDRVEVFHRDLLRP